MILQKEVKGKLGGVPSLGLGLLDQNVENGVIRMGRIRILLQDDLQAKVRLEEVENPEESRDRLRHALFVEGFHRVLLAPEDGPGGVWGVLLQLFVHKPKLGLDQGGEGGGEEGVGGGDGQQGTASKGYR